ncbi:hypothetical protein F5984_12105 [Rudanella paleaurantiibacter]|uniref:Uncharacterized protein n=1 Tax=Rudanella paleaurantiibacter TaxID=2614655 RepID=A0A7J5U1U1_9BACT|nr:hypothetical protein [Rudanella paleaurantiibacter]KAB7730878.1 hypothetical protein F5984_12105 [Rudanella paleaurantiibacter]
MQGSIRIWFSLLLTLVPVVIFWLCWGHLAVNVPKWDDHALKAYLLYSEQETDVSGKIYQLFRQHNEHRIVLDRMVTWLDYNLFGKLNYRHLMLLGNASLLGLLAVLSAVLHRTVRSTRRESGLVYAAPVAFLLFNLSSWENAFWGMAALQNFSVVLWVMGSLYCLTVGWQVWVAVGLAILATLTSGNGLLIWPIGVVVLLLQRQYRPLLGWSLSALVVIGLYFLGYENPEGNPPARGSVLDFFKGWLAFNGAAADVFPLGNPFLLCLFLGSVLTVGVLGAALWVFIRDLLPYALSKTCQTTPRPAAGNLFFVGCAAFLLGTGLIVAWSRVGFGLDVLITSRYKIYSLLLMAVAYVYAIAQLAPRWRGLAGTVGLVGSVAIAGLSYVVYADEVLWWRRWLLTNQFNWTYLSNRPVSGIDPTTARWVDNAPAYYDRCLPALYGPAEAGAVQLDTVYEAGGQFVVKSAAPSLAALPQPSLRQPDGGLTLILQSDKRTYLYGALPNPADNPKTALKRGIFPNRDLLVVFPAAEPAPDQYRLSVLAVDPVSGACTVHPTGRTLVVQPRSSTDLKKNW